MGKYFGTDGIRGKSNQGVMSSFFLTKVARSLGISLKQQKSRPKVLVGKDTRISGYMMEGAVASGLCSVGVDVFFVGPLPTPGVAYLTRGMRADAGIMLSASHNPYGDNGLKIFNANGFKLSDEQELAMEDFIDNQAQSEQWNVPAIDLGRAKRIDDAIGQYSVYLKEQFPKSYQLDGFKIVVDSGNGASYRVAPIVFRELGAQVVTINDKPNGFNINENAGALHPQSLAEAVVREKADIGFAYDGDADRIVVVDHTGHILDGDTLIAICAIHLKEKDQLRLNQICATIMSNMGLDVTLKKHDIKVFRAPVGDRYVVETMVKHHMNFGGENSGHIIYLDSATTGDGILTSLNLLATLIHSGKSLNDLAKIMIKFPQLHKNIPVEKKVPLKNLEKTSKLIGEIEKSLQDKGRLIIRYSGTENLLRVTLEGENPNLLKDFLDKIEHQVQSELSQ